MGVIPNPKMAFIFPNSCILALIFPNLLKYFPKCEGKGSFLKSQIKTLVTVHRSFKFGPYVTSIASKAHNVINYVIFKGMSPISTPWSGHVQ